MAKPKSKSLQVSSSIDPAVTKRLTALKVRATKFLTTWSEVEVLDTPSFEAAGVALKEGVLIRKDLKSLLDPEIKQAKADLKLKQDLYKSVDLLLQDAENTIRDALSSYNAAQQAKKNALVEKALEAGKDEKAASIAAKPFTPAVQGLSFTDHWHAEVENLQEFVSWCLSGPTANLEGFLSPNYVALNARARDLKAEDLGIPGVKGVKESSSTVRT